MDLDRIDLEATARFLGLSSPPPSPRELLLPFGAAGRAFLNRVTLAAAPLVGPARVLYRPSLRPLLPRGRPRLLVRVDDYPRADLPTDRFWRFADALVARGIDVLVGVTPLLRRDGRAGMTDLEVRRLHDALAAGTLQLAMHGTTHENVHARRGRDRHATTEIAGLPSAQIVSSLDAGLAALAAHGLPAPLHFIPPFNSVDDAAWPHLARRYRFVHGGPLSIDTLGALVPGVVVDGAGYLPSYRPYYLETRDGDFAARVARLIDALGREERALPLVLTVHWAWGPLDAPAAVRRLAAALDGATARWADLDPPPPVTERPRARGAGFRHGP
jgi:hypothetical protein